MCLFKKEFNDYFIWFFCYWQWLVEAQLHFCFSFVLQLWFCVEMFVTLRVCSMPNHTLIWKGSFCVSKYFHLKTCYNSFILSLYLFGTKVWSITGLQFFLLVTFVVLIALATFINDKLFFKLNFEKFMYIYIQPVTVRVKLICHIQIILCF